MDPTPHAPVGEPALHGHRSSEAGFDLVQAVRGAIRTSPWLTIAIAVHVLAGAIFAIVHLSHGGQEKEDSSIISVGMRNPDTEQQPVDEAPPELIDRKAIPDNVEAELVANEVAEITMSETLTEIDLTQETGDPNAIENLPTGATGGTAIGVAGAGHFGTGVPSAFSTRKVGKGGGPKGVAGGPTLGTEEAVRLGLVWLMRHQDKSGAWSAKTFSQHCPLGKPCQPETAVEAGRYPDDKDVGLTGLALLAYLGAGFGHDSKVWLKDVVNAQKAAIGKDIVAKGLKWLVERQNEDGSFARDGRYFLYNDALAALALTEAYGLTGNKYWKAPAQKAIDFLCKAQKPNPRDASALWGWRYQPADFIREDPGATPLDISDADMSVTGWMVMALKSAEMSGLVVPEATIKGALDFTRWSTPKSGRKGLAGYLGPETAGVVVTGEHDNFVYHLGTMSSISMCVRTFLEHDLKDPFLLEAADVLLNDLPSTGTDEQHPQTDYYYWYYGSLALNQIDGPDAPRRTDKYWGPWNRAMQDTVLALQDQEAGTCSAGGWMVPDRWAYGVGPVYTTAINILTLEVYYRFANAFGAKDVNKPVKAPTAESAPVEPSEPEAVDGADGSPR